MQNKNRLEVLYIENKLNTPYLFSIISNLVSDFKKSNNLNFEPLTEQLEIQEDTLTEEQQIKLELINYALKSVPNWFDRKLFEVYYLHGHSLRSLAKSLQINSPTVFYSIEKSKIRIKKIAKKYNNYEDQIHRETV